jgi:hypothetical protein
MYRSFVIAHCFEVQGYEAVGKLRWSDGVIGLYFMGMPFMKFRSTRWTGLPGLNLLCQNVTNVHRVVMN